MRSFMLFVALAIGLAPASADNVKIKYVLQCGAAKSVPPDDDADSRLSDTHSRYH
jgi:hypothetical protein